jgi:sulfur-oxidizing protein SoxA
MQAGTRQSKGLIGLLLAALAFSVWAQERADELAIDPFVRQGDELFRTKRGPKNESLETCDFGVGPGVLRGAYARLPRYFADSNKVEDLESRLMTCMARIQGFGEEAFPRHARGDARMAELARLAAFVAAQSSGMALEPPLDHPKEAEAYRVGERLYYRRAGAHDYSCAVCHAAGRRVAVQKIAPGEVTTPQRWIAAGYWTARHPQLRYGSEVSIALQVFLAQQAKGKVVAVPGVKP